MDAVAQAELVRRRELTPLELVDAAIARIELVNPKLNAVITPLFEDARKAAASSDLPDGPFRGVPFLLKDLIVMQKGQPYYAGNRALRDAGFRAPFDTPLRARFRAAGFITVGKTNTPEFGQQTTTQPLAFGATHNPWDLDRSTSGSSGGSCAAVAAGMVPIAHANDGGGSIRLRVADRAGAAVDRSVAAGTCVTLGVGNGWMRLVYRSPKGFDTGRPEGRRGATR